MSHPHRCHLLRPIPLWRQWERAPCGWRESKSREVTPFTSDLEAVHKTIEQDVLGLRFGGGTLIQPAVQAAALRFRDERHSERRRAVLIITDNIGVRTRSEKAVVRDFWEADALLSGLLISNRGASTRRTVALATNPWMIPLMAGMKGIAEKTGGDAISTNDPGPPFTESMHRIRSRYSLYYQQPEAKPGTTRGIRVELTGDAAKQHPKSAGTRAHGLCRA